MQKKIFGLIGYPISYSASPEIFKKKFQTSGCNNCSFELFSLPSVDNFKDWLYSQPEIKGLAVTIPHKVNILRYLDELDTSAEKVGAANCVRIFNGRTKGYNTDVFGFHQSLVPLLQSEKNSALILGTGGASKAVAYVLQQLEIPFLLVSREDSDDTNTITYKQLNRELIQDLNIIINCTPLGMGNFINEKPSIPYDALTPNHLLYDLNYTPEVTLFLKEGASHGARVKNGREMLELQAEKNWNLWNEGS